MNRRQALQSLAALSFPLIADGAPASSAKKGWAGGDAKLHKLFGARWYYTWSPKTRTSRDIEFIPMMKGEWSLKQTGSVKSMGDIKHLLAFNEPERVKQGNVTVERALALWPQLEALAKAKNLRIGSPAPSSDAAGMKWLDAFMEKAKRQKLKVDFVAVHWYRSRDAGEFESFIKKLDRDYRLPVWVTEFNGWSGPEKEHYDFLKKSLAFLEKSKSVERYAYFNPAKGTSHCLVTKEGVPHAWASFTAMRRALTQPSVF